MSDDVKHIIERMSPSELRDLQNRGFEVSTAQFERAMQRAHRRLGSYATELQCFRRDESKELGIIKPIGPGIHTGINGRRP